MCLDTIAIILEYTRRITPSVDVAPHFIKAFPYCGRRFFFRQLVLNVIHTQLSFMQTGRFLCLRRLFLGRQCWQEDWLCWLGNDVIKRRCNLHDVVNIGFFVQRLALTKKVSTHLKNTSNSKFELRPL